ncbi:MAG: hypothetical protein HDS44_02665 [Bacteroides sp.]|nr:hypothetical protein [Bacteroides sp.]
MKLFNKFALGCGLLGMSLTAIAADGGLLAFPGAEGFGRFTTGGRGGEIYHVTNLNDAGPGSLRDAVSKEGRIIVFDVSGVIELKSALVFKGNNTILGQTAPGEGIQVYGDRVSFSNATNLIVRNMRFRMGVGGTNGADACGVANGTDMIFDHLSVLWGRDENFSVSWDNKNTRPANITIQNSIIGQGLQSHSCGGLIQTIGGVTLYRNLYIENKTRNPKVKGLNQYVNNVVYNWGEGGCYIMSDSEGDSWADIENNYFVKGPWNGSTDPFVRGIQSFRYYGAGNYHDENKDGELNGHLMTEEEMRGAQNGTAPYSTYFASLDALNANITEFNATASEKIQLIPEISNKMTAQEAYAWMLENVGPVLPARDEVDQYIIDELASYGKTGTRNGITSEKQLPHKGTGVLSGGVKPLDSDGDAIPDEWEKANGLNPNDASDAAAIDPATGYAWIEVYANSITEAYPYIKKPISLAAGEPTKTSVILTWDVNKNTANGFVVELSTDGTTFTEAATAPEGTSTIELNGLTPETKYWVRLRSTDGNGLYSDYTDTIELTTIGDPSAPKPSVNPFPANGAKEGIANGLTLTWENNVNTYGGDVTYTVMFGEDKEALASVATGLTKTEWDASQSVTAGKTYYWRVDAINSLGTTTGDLWSFSTTAGGVLFYTDFTTTPAEYAEKYGSLTGNTDIYKKGSTDSSMTFNGMVIGVGSTASRVVAMPGCFSDDATKDYGPASDDDRGATANCIQFINGSEYVTTPAVQGPCVITYYLGNPSTSQQTVKLYTIAGGKETAQDLVLGAKKRIFKFTSTYANAGEVQFRLESNGKKIDVNDILIERYVAPDGEQALELSAGDLDNTVDYTDGSLTLTFNQEVKYNGNAAVEGIHQYETLSIGTSGAKLNIAYEALDANSTYVISFPEGVLTNVTGDKSFVGEVRITTNDFPREKADGETHWGKAAASLPLNFSPFNETAPFVTVGSLVQTAQNDYPHWCQVGGGDNAGEIAADHVTFRSSSSSDKVMAYFGGEAKKMYVEVSADEGSTVRLKIQETRNADIAPTWRTIRVLTEKDLPFKGEIDLNPASRFIKITPASVSGAVSLNAFRISDSQGSFGNDFTGIADITADDDNAPVEYFNLQGIRVDNPTPGLYIRRQGKKVEKVVVR